MCILFRNLLAVVEIGNDRKPTISVYDLVKSKHLRRLAAPLKMIADNFMKLEFSCDDMYLAALSKDPDYIMYYFNWKQMKIESRFQVVHPPNLPGPVFDVIFNHL